MPEARNAVIKVAGVTLSLNEYLQKFEEISGSKWEVVVDEEVKHRYQNKIEPSPEENLKAIITQNEQYKDLDNDKFSFTPCPVTEVIEKIVKQEA
ncbi:unnamed protein product [Rhizophagus irregularis]|nr:unnamed protein product [Rhizophagus irregularis]